MAGSWDRSRRAFEEAAGWFVATTRLVGDRWDLPGLGEWDVRSLVGHTSRAMLTVESYLDRPAAAVEVKSATGYFVATRTMADGPDVAARGRDAGTALGHDPAASVAAIAARVLPLVRGCDGTEVLTTVAGGMRLSDYLPTRTFELVAHTTDLAAALGVPADVPEVPALESLGLVSRMAVHDGRAGVLLRAALGRDGLPPGFSVL